MGRVDVLFRVGIVGAALAGATACGTQSVSSSGNAYYPTPSATPTASATASATPVPGVTPDAGNGHDGALHVSSTLAPNVCHQVLSASASTISVDQASGIDANRRVLVLQMQDDFATSGATASVSSPARAGNWELVRVATPSATSLALTTPLTGTYDSTGSHRAQVCTVPEYTDLTVDGGGKMVATPWNGTTGGVLVFMASGVATVSGTIDVSAAGFRGGLIAAPTQNFNVTNEDTTNGAGAGKGEGLDGRSFAKAGRGAMGNAAGGGDGFLAGGGGGANAGLGGHGGKEFSQLMTIQKNGGRAGGSITLAAADHRLIAGGGGGAGHHDDNMGGLGGNGGGIVLLIVNEFGGSGTILADGADGTRGGLATPGQGDGAGGGGAGGTIHVSAVTSHYSGFFSARGGNGGNVFDNMTKCGPGGGGGGGRVRSYGATSIAADVTGGLNGTNANNGADPYDSTAGVTGTTEVE